MGKTNVIKVAGAAIGVLSFLQVPVSALEVNSTTIGNNESSAQSILITREIKDVSYAVTNTFKYAISAVDTNPAAVTNLPKSAEISFSGAMPDENKQVKASTTVDFSGVGFSSVGDYKFMIRENGTNSTTRYPMNKDQYYVYAYVRYELDENSRPTGNLVATLAAQVLKNDEGDKMEAAAYEAAAVNSYIEVRNEVAGDLADPNKYFKYKVDLSKFPATEERYVVSGQDESIVYNGETITPATELVSGTAENYVYLKHGQTARIGQSGELFQVPISYQYKVSIQPEDGYASTLDGIEVLETDEKLTLAIPGPNAKTSTKEKFAAANTTLGVNTKNAENAGAVLTGVASRTWPIAVMILVGGMICAVFAYSAKERKE